MEIFAAIVLASIAMATIGLGIDVVINKTKIKEKIKKNHKNIEKNKKME